MSVTYKDYLLLNVKVLTEVAFNAILDQLNTGNCQFIGEIDRWDWEVESLIEGFSLLSEGVVLVRDAERRVSVQSLNTDLSLSLKSLIDCWNNLINEASIAYASMSEVRKRDLSEVDIDFDLYYKEVGS